MEGGDGEAWRERRLRKEFVRAKRFETGTLLGARVENRGDEVLRSFRDRRRLRESVLVGANTLIRSLHRGGLERGVAEHERVGDNADGPNVHLKRVAVTLVVVVENLWRDIVRGAADGLFALRRVLKAGGQTKVTKLDVQVCVEEEITKLQIAVDHVIRVEHVDNIYKLP